MREAMRKLFSPILNLFESGEGEFAYRESHRSILIIVGSLFLFLATTTLIAGIMFGQLAAALPFLIFLATGICCVVVGTLGSDRAVARIWRNR